MARQGEAIDDPWAADAGMHARAWHVLAAAAAGAAYSLLWLALGQPDVHLSQFFLPASGVIAGVAALTAPSSRRAGRAVPWLMAGFVALAISRLVAIFGVALVGDEPLSSNIDGLVLFTIGLVFFGGGWLNIARVTKPSRRLSPVLLAQIPPPAATWNRPRVITAETRDGDEVELALLQGGYLARPRHLDPGDVVSIRGT